MKNELIQSIFDWIRADWASNKFRFCAEILAWAMSIGCSITMAATVPNPPLLELYVAWIAGCSIYAWAAWTRKSFGMLANYLVLVGIDSVGLLRMLIND